MATYAEMLLDSAKSCALVDDDADILTNQETKRYSVYLKNAIAKFNNNPDVSIGTEKVIVNNWLSDEYGLFARIVRDSVSRDIRPLVQKGDLANGTNNWNISKLKADGQPNVAMAELPQRMQSALTNFRQGVPVPYYIFNEKQFFEVNRSERAVCYATRENEGIIRITRPDSMLFIFDRAIPFHFGIDNDIANDANRSDASQPDYLFNLLRTKIDIPPSHIPYLISLTAYELARGLKIEQEICSMLSEQINSQFKDLIANNISEKIHLSTTNRDYAFNWWNRRAYR